MSKVNKQNGIAAVWFMKNEPDAAILFCLTVAI